MYGPGPRKSKSWRKRLPAAEAELVDLETVVKRFVDAFNKLCDLTDYDKADLERFRLIHTYARDYPALLAEHERLRQVEEAIFSFP